MKPRLSLSANMHNHRERRAVEWSAGGVVSPPSLASEARTKSLLQAQAQAEVAVLPAVRAESGRPQEKTRCRTLGRSKPISFPSTLRAAFSSGPACSTGKTISPAWGLGAGWATFWSVFIQIPFLSSRGGGGGSRPGGGEGEAGVFICPPFKPSKEK